MLKAPHPSSQLTRSQPTSGCFTKNHGPLQCSPARAGSQATLTFTSLSFHSYIKTTAAMHYGDSLSECIETHAGYPAVPDSEPELRFLEHLYSAQSNALFKFTGTTVSSLPGNRAMIGLHDRTGSDALHRVLARERLPGDWTEFDMLKAMGVPAAAAWISDDRCVGLHRIDAPVANSRPDDWSTSWEPLAATLALGAMEDCRAYSTSHVTLCERALVPPVAIAMSCNISTMETFWKQDRPAGGAGNDGISGGQRRLFSGPPDELVHWNGNW